MLRKMRVISSLFLLVVMLLLLAFRVLPHHHHTLHLPESDVVVETLHFDLESCDKGGEDSHDDHDKCPSEHTYYLVKACEGLDYYKYTQSCDFSPAILSAGVELPLSVDVVVYARLYINLKIPDCRVGGLSLRAPPYAV